MRKDGRCGAAGAVSAGVAAKFPKCAQGNTVKVAKPAKRLALPTLDEQRDWQARAMVFCVGCIHYQGTTFNAAAKLAYKVKCGGCSTCGEKTVAAVQDCPLGLFQRVNAVLSPTP